MNRNLVYPNTFYKIRNDYDIYIREISDFVNKFNYEIFEDVTIQIKKTPKFLYYILIGYLWDRIKYNYMLSEYESYLLNLKNSDNEIKNIKKENFLKFKFTRSKVDLVYYIVDFIPKNKYKVKYETNPINHNSYSGIDENSTGVKDFTFKSIYYDYQSKRIKIGENRKWELYEPILKNFFDENIFLKYNKKVHDHELNEYKFYKHLYGSLQIEDEINLDNFIMFLNENAKFSRI